MRANRAERWRRLRAEEVIRFDNLSSECVDFRPTFIQCSGPLVYEKLPPPRKTNHEIIGGREPPLPRPRGSRFARRRFRGKCAGRECRKQPTAECCEQFQEQPKS